jgi:hypothetical protein
MTDFVQQPCQVPCRWLQAEIFTWPASERTRWKQQFEWGDGFEWSRSSVVQYAIPNERLAALSSSRCLRPLDCGRRPTEWLRAIDVGTIKEFIDPITALWDDDARRFKALAR